ncbi:MAG: DUF177 domain-containing protein [Deltaproteobacteria bacterium]|nr:MAG: DUF177 domain-containing protein [Deltaproteobacteria bacterium]
MKIALDDIKATPKELAYTEGVDELNARLERGVHDYRVPRGLDVRVEYYRAGLDVFFHGSLHGEVVGTCARCLEEYAFGLDHPFVFVLEPRAVAPSESARLSSDDLALSYYEGDEIDLTPLVHEQIILALPTRPLCGESCRGLCPRCGANLNAGACGCPAAPPDPRLAVLLTLRGK